MLRYVTGPGRAIAPRLYEELREALSAPGEHPLVVLVPEQYTLASERELLSALKLPGSFRLSVLSPGRLCSLVFEQAGRPQRVRIDDRGRVMLMHSALSGLSEELTWYRGAQHRRGFAELAMGQVKEFKQAGHTPESLLSLAESMPEGALRSKLTDISRMWSGYELALEGRFMDGEDEVLRALERVQDAPALAGCELWAYGFELVSQTLGRLLVGLCRTAKNVSLMLPMQDDELAPDAAVYEPVRRSLAHLDRMAREAGVERGRVYLRLPEQGQEPDALRALERQLFRYPCRPYEGPVENVRLVLCANPLEEAMTAMAYARRMMREKGWRCRDIAITGSSLAGYEQALRRASELYGLELFLPEERPADRHPLCQYLLLALQLIARGWQEAEMQLMLRTGFCGLTAEEADRMANYARQWGLRGRSWTQPLTRGDFEMIEPLRARLMEPLVALRDALSAARNTRDQLTALWRLLETTGSYEKLRVQQERLTARGEFSAANESAQVWNRLIGTMDQLAALLGDRRLSTTDLYELLSQSLAASAIKPLPQSNDAITVGALSRLRGQGVKAILVIGCAGDDGSAEKGLFLPPERRVLEEQQGVWLSPDAYDRSRLGALDLKAVLSLAGEAALFTYPQSAEDGSAVQPGALVGWLKRILPGLRTEGGLSGQEELARLLYETPEAALELLPPRLSGQCLTRADREALSALARLPEHEGDLAVLQDALTHRIGSAPLPGKLARRLYEGPERVSVTRLETFAACPFKHFAQYGLRPEIIDPPTLEPKDEGTFFHEALERFLRQAAMPVTEQTLEESMDQMDEVTERLMGELMDGPLGEDPVLLARGRRLRGIARTAARTAARHLVHSRFQPMAFEIDFGRNDEIVLRTDQGDVPVEGRIDRIDLWREGSREYLRIIDYKSGRTEINLPRLYWGLQLQLIIYLAAALKRTNGRPAGAFYFHVQDPTLRTEERSEEVVDRKRADELRLSGLFLNDPEVLSAMAPDFERSIRLTVNRDGTVRKSDRALEEQDFDALLRHAVQAAGELTRQILSGNTQVAPVRIGGSYDACQFCDYQALCQADPRVQDTHREMPSLSSEEAMRRMREENGVEVE